MGLTTTTSFSVLRDLFGLKGMLVYCAVPNRRDTPGTVVTSWWGWPSICSTRGDINVASSNASSMVRGSMDANGRSVGSIQPAGGPTDRLLAGGGVTLYEAKQRVATVIIPMTQARSASPATTSTMRLSAWISCPTASGLPIDRQRGRIVAAGYRHSPELQQEMHQIELVAGVASHGRPDQRGPRRQIDRRPAWRSG